MGLFKVASLVQYVRGIVVVLSFTHFYDSPLRLFQLYLLQGLLKVVSILCRHDHLSVQLDLNIDFLHKIYMLTCLSNIIRPYVLLCLASALYLEVLGSWMLMIAAFMRKRQHYDEHSVVKHNGLVAFYHNQALFRYLLNLLSEAFLICLYLSAFPGLMSPQWQIYNHQAMFYCALPGLLLRQSVIVAQFLNSSRYLILQGKNQQFS